MLLFVSTANDLLEITLMTYSQIALAMVIHSNVHSPEISGGRCKRFNAFGIRINVYFPIGACRKDNSQCALVLANELDARKQSSHQDFFDDRDDARVVIIIPDDGEVVNVR